MTAQPHIAIIGAGISGLRLAHRLSAHASIKVLEKSRGLGGRMSTRRADDFHFDHGAQYFTAHGAAFQSFLTPFVESGAVARWSPRIVSIEHGETTDIAWSAPRYVGVPGMTALCKAMAADLDIISATRVSALRSAAGRWTLETEGPGAFGPFDWVLSTAPAEQSARLMPSEFTGGDALRATHMQGCYSLMLGYAQPVDLPWQAAVVTDSPLAWIALNTSKPGRSGAVSILCQSSNDWAEAHIEADQNEVRAALCAAFTQITGIATQDAAYTSLHKWRFAKVSHPSPSSFLIDPENRLGAAGDWCGAGRIEAGFDAASALADSILKIISI